MSYPVFHVPAGDTLPIFFSTYAGATGASITASGLAVTDIEIYKDGGTTQRASDAGYTLLDTDGLDFDAITGIHGFSINTGDNTDAGFYTVGAWFTVVVSAITVDTQTVSFIAAQFRLMAAENVAGVPAGDATHAAGTAWGSGAITAASLAADAITAAKVADDVSTEFRTKALALTTCSGTVGSGSTTANVVASAVAVGATTSISADAWKGRVIIFNSDTATAALRGQAGVIQSHTSGSTPTFTMLTGAWTNAPLSSDTFTVV